ncbi:MAG: MFS transporter [Lachnospiraceae bacterium]|nr:MFS transporter [Lachnospiraceae bacterium]
MNEKKLDKRTKWSYCVGATGRDMAYTLVSMFLLTYIQYTMMLTVAQFAAISAIVVVCLLWDAVNDPLMGIIIENARLKSGKFKPWILLGVILNCIVIVCLFTVRPVGWGFVIFFGIGYLLWGMTYTMNDIAYWGMLPSLSSDPKERNMLVTIQGIFICIGQFSVAGLLPDMVAGQAVMAYRIAAIVISSCFLGFQLLTFFGVKERPRQENKEVLSLKDMFGIFFRNDQLVAIGIACLLFQVGNGLLIMIGMNFFYFEFGYSVGGTLVFWFTVMYGLGTLLSEAGFAFIASHLSRAKIIAVSTGLTILGYLLLLSVGYVLPKNEILINAIGFMIFFAQGLFNMTMIVMLNNTIEYDEVRYNERHDSIISAVRSFATKLASAIDQGAVALILIISGIYAVSQNISNLEREAGAGVITSEQVIEGADRFIETATAMQRLVLRIGIASVPVIAIGAAFIIIKRKYVIDEKKYDELVKEIEERKSKT